MDREQRRQLRRRRRQYTLPPKCEAAASQLGDRRALTRAGLWPCVAAGVLDARAVWRLRARVRVSRPASEELSSSTRTGTLYQPFFFTNPHPPLHSGGS